MSSSFADAARRRALNGATVTEFDCRGCMARNHVFVRTFRITSFETVNGVPCAVGTILVEGSQSHLDWPEYRTIRVPIHHSDLQQIEGPYWCLYK